MNFTFLSLFENDMLTMIPEVFLLSVILVLLMYGVFYAAEKTSGYPTMIVQVVEAGILTVGITASLIHGHGHSLCMDGHLIQDEFTALMKLIMC